MTDNTPELILFAEISVLIEQGRNAVVSQANHTATMLYWKIGNIINTAVLQEKRAEYGKRIVSPLATQFSGSHFIELLPLKSSEARLLCSTGSEWSFRREGLAQPYLPQNLRAHGHRQCPACPKFTCAAGHIQRPLPFH